MDLIITEKPSVARTIARVVGANEKKEGYLSGDGYLVTWCVGHLVELAPPEAYGDEYKEWKISSLPIIPKKWKYEVKPETRGQYETVCRLLHDDGVANVICATDAGREGELIFRLVYEMSGAKKNVMRLWVSSMEESAIQEALDTMRPDSDYDNLYDAAICRQHADWLVGINGTRLFSYLNGKTQKVGRVQTPTLSMLAEREAEISNFRKAPYYEVVIEAGGIRAKSEKYSDKEKAEEIQKKCQDKPATASSVTSEDKHEAPPRLYDLTSIQRDANRLFGMTAKQTLDTVQSLYEQGLVTYPRTDSCYLTEDMADTARDVIEASLAVFPYLADTVQGAKMQDISRILDSSKVTDHHAIIPTMKVKSLDMETLTKEEEQILSLDACRLLAATSERYLYRAAKVQVECAGETFQYTGKAVTHEGFKACERAFRGHFGMKAEAEGDSIKMPLPEEGSSLGTANASLEEGTTKPPRHYTEDTLLAAMERAGAEDTTDDAERKGLGTPATRADVIEKLVHDGFARREGKNLVATEEGIELLSVLPDDLKSPKLTSEWENSLSLVSKGAYPASEFMGGICAMVEGLVKEHEDDVPLRKPKGEPIGKCPNCGSDVVMGMYGAYCTKKCGLRLANAFGKRLTESQARDLLAGKPFILKGLKSKAGKPYDAKLTPDGVKHYAVNNEDGTSRDGIRMMFQVEICGDKANKRAKRQGKEKP